MRLLFFLLLLLGVPYSLPSQKVYTPQTVPNPKQERSTVAVSDPDTLLSPAETFHLNAMLKEIEDSTTVQFAVVVLRSIGNADPDLFAHQLFNQWGVGYQDKNNGLLLLLVIDQRAWRFETGYGLEGVLPDALLKRIGTQQMLPSLQQGHYGLGIIAGVTEVKDILQNPSFSEEIYSEAGEEALLNPGAAPDTVRYQTMWYLLLTALGGLLFSAWLTSRKKINSGTTVILFFFCIEISVLYIVLVVLFDCTELLRPALPLYLYIYLHLVLLVLALLLQRNNALLSSKKDALFQFQDMKAVHRPWLIAGLLILMLPLVFYFIWYYIWVQKQKQRFAPRTGKQTGKPLRRLGESEEDRFLKKEQLLEEQLRSVDYDVWVSDDLKDIEVLEYVRFASGYSACPKCQVRSLFYTNKVITAATTVSSGRGKKTHTCKNCSYKKEEFYTIPKKSSSSSSGSSGSGWSSGGSSWGGGSSGGGGAGGRW